MYKDVQKVVIRCQGQIGAGAGELGSRTSSWPALVFRRQPGRVVTRRTTWADGWLGSVRNGELNWEVNVSESYCAVITSTDRAEEAEELGRGIVETRLGACVQIVGPIRSVYRWEGEVRSDQEWQCWVKTSADRLDALTEYIKKNHSYDVPEVVALSIVGGSADYLSWVRNETQPG